MNEFTATYSPEDNKLRLYVGRVPRDEYERLRAEGWTSTPKQNCNFVATWTPQRRDTALEYADIIEDEDMGPDERAADRAERFGDYRDKRTDEAIGHADMYDSGPSAHGYQSAARAERAAARHDRIGGRAVDSWGKAEYWVRRTAGVISHALYKSSPSVRMGRIKVLEAELRKARASITESQKRFETWQKIANEPDPAKQFKFARHFADYTHRAYLHPVTGKEDSLWRLLEPHEGDEQPPITGAQSAALVLANWTRPADENDWTTHYNLRLAYENQMLEAQGGRAAFIEMEVGGWIGGKQILKVNKSAVTGRVVSVAVKTERVEGWHYRTANVPNTDYALTQIDTERLPESAYRPPTPEDIAAIEALKAATKAAMPTKAPCPLINPTDADAERLQAVWNERAKARHIEAKGAYRTCGEFQPAKVTRVSQAVYSNASKGSYGRAETRGLCADGELLARFTGLHIPAAEERRKRIGPKVCLLRITSGGSGYYTPESVIVLTDKPQKPLPAQVWEALPVQPELVTV